MLNTYARSARIGATKFKQVSFERIIIFCYQKGIYRMYYFTDFLGLQFQNVAFYPLNFIIPSPYPYIIDPSLSRNHTLATAERSILKQQTHPDQPYTCLIQPKKEETNSEEYKVSKQERENHQPLPSKEQLRTNRDYVCQIDEDGKISVRIEWRNQNRNIIPNIMNQLMSYITKPLKSKKMVTKICSKQKQNSTWTPMRYYNYLKIIKENASHYLDECDLKTFFIIQSPHCTVYSSEEQEFYMKVCRILVCYFLKSEIVLISTTSTRMNEYNRKIHLIGRQILLKIFYQMAEEFRLR